MSLKICLPVIVCFVAVCHPLNIYNDIWRRYVNQNGPATSHLIPEPWYQNYNNLNSDSDPTGAAVWLDNFNDELQFQNQREVLINWKFVTNITDENAQAVTNFASVKTNWMKKKKLEASKFNTNGLKRSTARMLYLIRNVSFSFNDKDKARLNAELVSRMSQIYSTTKVKMADGSLASGEPDLADLMRSSRNYDELLFAWKSWRDSVGPHIRPLYTQMVQVENKAATDQGYHDMGEVWRKKYEVNNLEAEAKEIWNKLKPLYQQLHAYVRRKLSQYYGSDKVDVTGPIPAHLLGNMWGQEWAAIMDIVKPYNESVMDVTAAMKKKAYNVEKIFKVAEDFYTSMGLYPMTKKFWKLSMLEDPGGSVKVDCHGSAEDFSTDDDFRIKMCTSISSDSFVTAHHEMGHIEYFMSYSKQPEIFKSGANPGFHEAIGDSITYSVMTPEHLHRIGLIDNVTNNLKSDINFLLGQALQNLALIPWTLLIDFWRYDIFRGKIDESNYNAEWWRYRLEFQGIKPPIERNESHFDPGAKYHIPYNVPYIRYFFARILQLQFHSTMCDLANGPNRRVKLHHCDVYGSLNAGRAFKKMMGLGASRPWWDSLQVMTGSSKLNAQPILEYYDPLYRWLVVENEKQGEVIGW